MTIQCWVALCPHCHVVWCVESHENPCFDEHPSEPTPLAEYLDWRKRCDQASQGVLRAFEVLDTPGHPEHEAARTWIDTSNRAMEALLAERRGRTVWCQGGGQLATAAVLNGSPEAQALDAETSAYWDRKPQR